eukprot:2612160-Pyramimonas_sp.AAC.1
MVLHVMCCCVMLCFVWRASAFTVVRSVRQGHRANRFQAADPTFCVHARTRASFPPRGWVPL